MTETTPAPAGPDELDALLTAATPGDWSVDEDGDVIAAAVDPFGFLVTGVSPADAALIVALRNRAPAMLAAIRAAYALAEEMESAAELYDAAALDGRMSGDLMAEGGHLIQAGDARRFTARLRAGLDEALGASGE